MHVTLIPQELRYNSYCYFQKNEIPNHSLLKANNITYDSIVGYTGKFIEKF